MRTYQIDNRGKEPKYYYLYKEIKEDILSGVLKKSEKLPSKRTLAEHLGISLITVENAYQMLKDEGYIETRERSGYFVCEIHAGERKGKGTRRLTHLPLERNYDEQKSQTDFFPTSLYFKTVRGVISEYGKDLLVKSPNEGCAILRNSIAEYLLRYRGVFAQPEQIIIGSGAEDLYGILVRLLGNDRLYGIEDPSYEQIQKVYEGTGARVDKLKMGSDGICSQDLNQTSASVLHVTPFHSYPSNVTATVGKRYEYLKWAMQDANRYIIEDDFDSEFFMPGKPIDTLYMLDNHAKVIYINTFTKSLSPSIRMGYMILPEQMLDTYKENLGGFSCSVPVLDQYVLAEFMNKGYFEQHLNRVRRKRLEE